MILMLWIDAYEMFFGAMVYHWWMNHDYVVHGKPSLTLIHLMVSFYYDFGLWWSLLGDITYIFYGTKPFLRYIPC
jgi:hypothetical protein